MLTISKPLSASQVRTYHEREFASERQNYWSRNQQGHSEWQGKLAEQWGLSGPVGDEHFARLTGGQHPITEALLVRHQVSKIYEGKFGKEATSVEHRAGWDATFSAPKSVSLTALVGGDERGREAHRERVCVALAEFGRYTQARIGNVHAPETTGKFVAATFEHDTARPVDGYAAPQLHTHAVIFKVTERDKAKRAPCCRRSHSRRSPLLPAFIVPSWRCACQAWAQHVGYGEHGDAGLLGDVGHGDTMGRRARGVGWTGIVAFPGLDDGFPPVPYRESRQGKSPIDPR